MRPLSDAPFPTFFKMQLSEAARGTKDGRRFSYYDVGFHLGQHHLATFDLNESAILDVTAEDEARPTATLRMVLANDSHSDAPMVHYIPSKRRRSFLEGLVDGTSGESRYTES
ncbi:MAG: hypothetical protein ACRD3C_23900 [Vicinamibacterales bacterium]